SWAPPRAIAGSPRRRGHQSLSPGMRKLLVAAPGDGRSEGEALPAYRATADRTAHDGVPPAHRRVPGLRPSDVRRVRPEQDSLLTLWPEADERDWSTHRRLSPEPPPDRESALRPPRDRHLARRGECRRGAREPSGRTGCRGSVDSREGRSREAH